MHLVRAVVAALAQLFLVLVLAGAGQPSLGAPSDAARALHAEGRQVRDGEGHAIQLRGVNLGGWLVTEGWMNGQSDSEDRWALERLEARFGGATAARLMTVWQDHWITGADLDLIRKTGFNLLRVPFGHRNLQDAQGRWLRDASGAIDFSRFDWIVREADKRGMYVMFDLHTWPGQRDDYEQIGQPGAAGQAARSRAAALWSEVARHFRGVAAVAAFDVVNEPPRSPRDVLQSTLIDAIRKQDPDRMLVVQGVAYPSMPAHRWKNVVWSAHYPSVSVDEWAEELGIAGHPEVRVPVLVGELKAPEDAAAAAKSLVRTLEARQFGWAVWTWKGVDVGGWAAIDVRPSLKVDLSADSEDTIAARWKAIDSGNDPAGAGPSVDTNAWWIEGFGR